MEGYSQDTLRFLFENRAMDSRAWFHEHREEYERLVLAPTRELVTALAPAVRAIDPELSVEPKVGRCISHINRDTRFTLNKELYRDVVWIAFCREKYAGYPSLYFEFSPRALRWGCGWHETPKPTVERIRGMALCDSPLWQSADACLHRAYGAKLEDARYKRTHFPVETEQKRAWLDQRTFCVTGESEALEPLFAENLSDWVGKRLRRIAPVYQLFLQATLSADRENDSEGRN